MIISFISHYIRKANVTHAGTISGSGPGEGARGRGKAAGLSGGGRGRLRRSLGEISLRWGGWKRGISSFEVGQVHFWWSDLSSVKRGGGDCLLPPPPTHTVLALARPAQGLARRFRVAFQRGWSVQRDRSEGPGVTAPLLRRDPFRPPKVSKEWARESEAGRQR